MPVTDRSHLDNTTPEAPNARLLEVLVCPMTRSSLYYDQARQELISKQARKAYPIRSGVPIMLVEEARDLADDE